MPGINGIDRDATWKAYATLHKEWEYSSAIEDWMHSYAEQGYSKSEASDSLFGEISMWLQSDYEESRATSSPFIKDLMLSKSPFEMGIDWTHVIDMLMEDYDEIVESYKPKSSKNARSKPKAKAPAKKTAQRRR